MYPNLQHVTQSNKPGKGIIFCYVAEEFFYIAEDSCSSNIIDVKFVNTRRPGEIYTRITLSIDLDVYERKLFPWETFHHKDEGKDRQTDRLNCKTHKNR